MRSLVLLSVAGTAFYRLGLRQGYRPYLQMVGLAACLGGCSLPNRKPVSPAATVALSGGASVTQTGDAQKPASISSNIERATETKRLPLPAGTELIFNEKLGTLTLRLSQATTLEAQATHETKIEQATAPQAFTPPAPPTPTDLAAGKAHLWLWIGLVAGVAAGLFGLVRDWNLLGLGGAAIAGACALGLFVQMHPLIFAVIGIGTALTVAGPAIWHLYLKQHSEPKPSTP